MRIKTLSISRFRRNLNGVMRHLNKDIDVRIYDAVLITVSGVEKAYILSHVDYEITQQQLQSVISQAGCT